MFKVTAQCTCAVDLALLDNDVESLFNEKVSSYQSSSLKLQSLKLNPFEGGHKFIL